MKKTSILFLAALVGSLSITHTSCIGSFGLTSKVLEWNKGLGKWVDELVFLVFIIIPVYGVAVFIDAVILNTIEFWTGSNPVAMKEGETETQLVKGEDGNNYSITASKNRFDIKQLDGEKAGEAHAFVFNSKKKSWSLETPAETIELASFNEKTHEYTLHYPNGEAMKIDANQSMTAIQAEVDYLNATFASK